MAFGTSTQIINSARVTIKRAGSEVSLTSDVKLRRTRIVDRINTRAGAIDTFRWILVEIEFTAAWTELLVTQLNTDDNISVNSKMTFNTWLIEGISISGQAGDKSSDSLSATLLDYEQLAPENGIANIRIKLRVVAGAD